jgi:hypothetical protein
MKTNSWVKVARYHLVDRFTFTVVPWIVLTFDFLITIAVTDAIGPVKHPQAQSGAVFAIYVFFLIIGAISVFRSLPFGLAVGVSRRAYYAGTTLLALALAAIDGLALAMLQVIERATNGWGVTLHFFRMPYLLNGPWYLTWLTSFVLLALAFVYGMWFGLVYRRWNLIGLLAFAAAQIIVLAGGAALTTVTHAWSTVGHFFTTLSVVGLTGLLAALAGVLLAGGYTTIRHVTI